MDNKQLVSRIERTEKLINMHHRILKKQQEYMLKLNENFKLLLEENGSS